MLRCRKITRQVSGVRCATGFLILMVCLQASLRVTQAAVTKKQPNDIQTDSQEGVQAHGNSKRAWETAFLLTARHGDGEKVPALQDGIYIWWMLSSRGKFTLKDKNTTLVVPKNGLYLLNLKMYYSIDSDHQCKQMLFLNTFIQQYHSSYPKWREVITGRDTMQCVQDWQQSVTLTQVIRLNKGTMLRVKIDPKNYPFIIWDDSTYFTVTRL
ncbi:uncharacterized protein LOC113637245 [Tachysurus fulvidraco]|uniref:uncharacterized protein LOC113637245 n=1 Tax=Tachysurus fulvidraco TaxID=1234273 RepID=UPI001FEF0011|nr:uncharacterized protein LOC113637245 [Tachysurus fulvidraco]